MQFPRGVLHRLFGVSDTVFVPPEFAAQIVSLSRWSRAASNERSMSRGLPERSNTFPRRRKPPVTTVSVPSSAVTTPQPPSRAPHVGGGPARPVGPPPRRLSRPGKLLGLTGECRDAARPWLGHRVRVGIAKAGQAGGPQRIDDSGKSGPEYGTNPAAGPAANSSSKISSAFAGVEFRANSTTPTTAEGA